MTPPLSMVLVTVDCLRADHVGFLGYRRRTTPFLDSLSPESFVVPNAIVGGVPTYYSFPALLASRHPLTWGRNLIGLSPDEISLPTYLKQRGYATAAFLAANPYLSARFGYDQGFDVFRDFLEQDLTAAPVFPEGMPSGSLRTRLNRAIAQASHRLGPLGRLYDDLYFEYCHRATPGAPLLNSIRPYPSADVIVGRGEEWLGAVASSRPFFLWLHLMDPHAPYYPDEEAQRAIGMEPLSPRRARYLNGYWNRSDLEPRRLSRQRDAVIELYDAGIHWVDIQLERLVKTLQSLRVWDRCAFVLTADHGEEFLEHGARFHAPGPMKEELIRVPLMVRVPGVPGREVSRKPFSQVDLAPTLLEAMREPVPAGFQGCSRWSAWRHGEVWDDPAIVDSVECGNPNRRKSRLSSRVLCVREDRYKLILRCGSGEEQLFDLQSDPCEDRPLPAAAERVVRRSLLAHAAKHIQRTRQARPLDFDLRAHLRDLRVEMKAPVVEHHRDRTENVLSWIWRGSPHLLGLAATINQIVDIYPLVHS